MTRRTVAADKVICMDADGTVASWLSIEDGRIAEVGAGDPPNGADRLEGVILPGLIDSHIHLTATGLYASGLDLRDARSVEDLLRRLGDFVRSQNSEWVIGGNFDPGRNVGGRMPTGREIDSVASDRIVLISRADGHSCALNRRGFRAADLDPSLPGVELGDDGQPTGVLANRANYQARNRFFSALPDEHIHKAQKAACGLALTHGVTCVQEMAGGSFMGDRDFDVLIESRLSYPIRVVPYLATFDFTRVEEAGLRCVGGDLFLDGSIGSHTAAMTVPYEDADTVGFLYHDDDHITEFFYEASRRGLQAGVHAIGDAAVEQALRCLTGAFSRMDALQADQARGLRHRIEHFECTSAEQLDRAAALGVVASVQPMFDGYWGGPEGMYRTRLGDRAATMNPFSEMVGRKMVVAGGSDSTVTPLDPLLGMSAAIGHNTDSYRVSVADALRMFTVWAAKGAHLETEIGSIETGKRADFCVVGVDPFEVDIEELASLPVLQTWKEGSPVWVA